MMNMTSENFDFGTCNVSRTCNDILPDNERHIMHGTLPLELATHVSHAPMHSEYMYTRKQLIELKKQHKPALSNSTIKNTIQNGLAPRKCGCRGGIHVKKKISVLISDSDRNSGSNITLGVNSQNLVKIPLTTVGNTTRTYDFPSFYLCNPRSLNNKTDEFRSVVLQNQFDICAVSESWFRANRTTDYFDNDVYTIFSRPRSDRKGGEVAPYLNQNLHASLINVDIPDELEIFWVQARPPKLPRSVSTLIIGAVYFIDANQETLMLEHIQNTLDILRAKHPNAGFYIVGDVNRLDVASLCRNNGFKQVVDKPTRGNAILDKIITNVSEFYLPITIGSPIGPSDHSTVMWLPKKTVEKARSKPVTRTVRPIKDSDFGTWIVDYDWKDVIGKCKAIESTDAFYDILKQRMDFHFRTWKIKHHVSDKPWISTKTKDLIRRRQEVFDHSKPPLWRFYRNKVNHSIVADKREYYKNRVERHKKSNPGEWYRQIKVMTTQNKSEVLITPPPDTDPSQTKEVTNSINNHFVSIGKDIKPLDTCNLPAY